MQHNVWELYGQKQMYFSCSMSESLKNIEFLLLFITYCEWVKSLSCVQLFATPWTVAYQAPLSMGVSRQESWSGLPLPSLSTSLQRIWMCLQASLRCSKLNKSPREISGVPPMCSMYQILPLLSPSYAVPFIYAFLQLRANSIFSHLEDSLFCVAVSLGAGML